MIGKAESTVAEIDNDSSDYSCMMSINFFIESVYSASHLSTVLPLVGWYGERLECVKPSRLQAWVQECKWHCSWINFVMEFTALCWQAKASCWEATIGI